MINLHGIIFLRIMCLCQLNIKLIIAISSIVRIRIILTSILLITKLRLHGRYYIIIRHGVISSGLFYFINLIYIQTEDELLYTVRSLVMVREPVTSTRC